MTTDTPVLTVIGTEEEIAAEFNRLIEDSGSEDAMAASRAGAIFVSHLIASNTAESIRRAQLRESLGGEKTPEERTRSFRHFCAALEMAVGSSTLTPATFAKIGLGIEAVAGYVDVARHVLNRELEKVRRRG